ncbi:hypothetical protein LUZ60_010082 [Juncus effusus]|nr:hypothetical protein LUZ60_010082 [Juncus effusus]
MLSLGGRTTLVKLVLSSISTYTMQVFLLPSWLIKQMNKIIRSFFWKGDENCKGGHCLARWKKCCLPKTHGGLGILDLRTQNISLLLRWLWRLDDPTNSLWKDIISSLYGVNNTRDISLITQNSSSFFIRALLTLLPIYFTTTTPSPHGIVWRWGTSSIYSSQIAYKHLIHPGVIIGWQSHLWKLKAPSKVKLFLWLAINDKILTSDNLQKRGSPICIMCRRAPETGPHLLSFCPYAVGIWTHLLTQWNMYDNADNFFDKWRTTSSILPTQERKKWNATWAAACWMIWTERNKRIFTGKSRPHQLLVKEINHHRELWLKFC